MRGLIALLLAALMLGSSIAQACDKTHRALRTRDGKPDVQGLWELRNVTPLVRPSGFPAEISQAQARAIEKIVYDFLENPNVPIDPTGEANKRYVLPVRGTLRSSIVVDPPDGQLPGTPLFYEQIKKKQWAVLNGMDGPEQRPSSERCLGDTAAQPPILHNPGINMHQIVQTPDTIIFFTEVMHEARVIRMNARHAPSEVTSWLGDSIGRWEGDTLWSRPGTSPRATPVDRHPS